MTTAELEARIAELEAAIEWIEGVLRAPDTDWKLTADELRARAFPPKTEPVTEKRMVCQRCGQSYTIDEHRDWCCQEELVEFNRTYNRPIVAKVKKREELNPGDINPMMRVPGAKYFRETEEP